MEPAGLPGNSGPSVCSRNTGIVGYAAAHQVDRAAGLVAGEEQDVSDTYEATPFAFSTVLRVPRPSIPPSTYINTSVSMAGGSGHPLIRAT